MKKFFHKFGIHFWVYRNPADRRCEVCGKHQQEWISIFEGENPFVKRGWWEDL